jgi:glycosyltransferase involved in cell wall biosynthesis
MKITAIIMTFNEEIHIRRCLESLEGLVSEILIVDSFSTDKTIEIASSFNVRILQNPWINHSIQFNWALGQLTFDTDWIFRVDADEYLSNELYSEIKNKLTNVSQNINGIFIKRSIVFQGKTIRFGGIDKKNVLRLFRFGFGYCESRWMDEHIKISGLSLIFSGNLIDNNLQPISWWIDKHNNYASKEAIEFLNSRFKFISRNNINTHNLTSIIRYNRFLKESIYNYLPLVLRSFIYFLYRYFIRLGFLDGSTGFLFHFLQGFWYRLLVDLKIIETLRFMKKNNVSVIDAIRQILGIKI